MCADRMHIYDGKYVIQCHVVVWSIMCKGMLLTDSCVSPYVFDLGWNLYQKKSLDLSIGPPADYAGIIISIIGS